jgi:hypothetical protein
MAIRWPADHEHIVLRCMPVGFACGAQQTNRSGGVVGVMCPERSDAIQTECSKRHRPWPTAGLVGGRFSPLEDTQSLAS